MPKHETRNTLLNNLGSKHGLVMKIYVVLQNKFFIKKFYEKCGLETSSRSFLIFQESPAKSLRRSAC